MKLGYCFLLVPWPGQLQAQRDYISGGKTRIHRLNSHEASNQEGRAHQQDQRKRDLRNYEDAPYRAAPRTHSSSAFLERFVQVQPRGLQRRSQAEYQASQQ